MILLSFTVLKHFLWGFLNLRIRFSVHLQSEMLKSSGKAWNLGVIMVSDLRRNRYLKHPKPAFYHLKIVARIKGLMSQWVKGNSYTHLSLADLTIVTEYLLDFHKSPSERYSWFRTLLESSQRLRVDPSVQFWGLCTGVLLLWELIFTYCCWF